MSNQIDRRNPYLISGGRVANLLWLVRRALRFMSCKHTHTFTVDLGNARWQSSRERKGAHGHLKLRGCYLCGDVRVEDFGA